MEGAGMKTIGELVRDREPYFVGPDLTVKEIVNYLDQKGVGAVAVCEGDRVVGVFSERDLARRVVAKELDPRTTKVHEVMSRDVICVSTGDSLAAARALMLDKKFRHLVVLDEEHRFRGFVSMREILEVDLAESKKLITTLNDDYYEHQFKPGE
jgi:CBS domain-containing protein